MSRRYRNILSSVISSGGIDPDAQAYITALANASYIVNAGEQTAINNHFLDLKGTGPNNSTYDWWTGIIRLLPFIGTTSTQQAIKAESPTNSITFGGGVSHNSTGVQGNAVNGYYVFFDPSELTDVNDWSGWVYKGLDLAEDKWDFSAQNQTSGRQIGIRSRTASFNNLQCSAGGPFLDLQSSNGSITNGSGFVGISKYQALGFDAYVRGTQFVKVATGYVSPGIPVYGLANNRSVSAPEGYSANEHRYSLITSGIATTVEAAALKTTVEAFMTALSRNVL